MKQTFFLLLLAAQTAWANQPLSYTFSPSPSPGRLRVTLAFEGNANGLDYLGYQENQFGEANQMAFLEFPEQLAGITLSKQPEKDRIEVRHQGGRVSVVYEVLDRQADTMPFYQYCCYKPIVQSAYFHIQSGHLLAVPEEYWKAGNDLRAVRFHWAGFPEDWTLHHSFGARREETVLLTQSALSVAVFVGGDFRRHTFEVRGQPVHLLTRGQWVSFSDDTLLTLLRRTVEGHRAFWNDFSDTLYSVTFLPIHDAPWTPNSQYVSVGGSGLTNSFLSYATNNPGVRYDLIRYLWMHELMHHWVGTRIVNEQEEKQYWFSEGFTDYFTLKNSLAYGLIGVSDFVKQLNQVAAEHYASPIRSVPNDSLNYERFWNGGKEWEKLPYRRGFLYAFFLDNLIREKSGGQKNLDGLMRHILEETNRNPEQKMDHGFLTASLRKYTGGQLKHQLKNYIEQGTPIDFRKTKLPDGIEVVLKDITMNYGPSPDVIEKTEVLKNIPVFSLQKGREEPRVREALLR